MGDGRRSELVQLRIRLRPVRERTRRAVSSSPTAHVAGVRRMSAGRSRRAADPTPALKADVALACRVLAAEDQGDNIWGHVSVRDPGGRGLWMKPAAMGLEEIRANDLLLVSLEGEVLLGRHPRHSEYPIHA